MPIDYSKLRNLTAREIVSALSRDGLYLRSQKGCHQRYHHPDGRTVTVSFHNPGDTFPQHENIEKDGRKTSKWTDHDLRRLKISK
ncbi:MAG: type II toxin-antitoxin system HicA family toxin [Euryarchaeota archaeon]|nr:type II toxin-antitoxin system HicA family toxin [Euryarchaeota archaeon]